MSIKSVLGRVVNALTSGTKKVFRATAQSVGIAWNMWIREVWPDIDKRTAIEEGYATNTALFSIVNHDAEKFASIPRYVYDANSINNQGSYNKKIQEGPQVKKLLALLKKPNPGQSQSELLELLRIFYKSTGDGYIWLNRGDVVDRFIQPYVDTNGQLVEGTFVKRTDAELDAMPILEMHVLPSGFVGVIPEPGNVFGVYGYWLEINGVKHVIRKNDMIHWKRQNPVFDPVTGDHLKGLNPFQVGKHTIQENKDAVAATDRMFKNDGAKGVLVNENLRWDQLDEKQKQNIIDIVDSRVNNAAEVKGAVATLGGKWNYLNIAKDSVDKSLLEGKKFTWQELCFLLSMPYELFDSKTTYANKEQAQKGWVSNTILPACTSIDNKFTERLAPAFGLIDGEGNATVVIGSDFSMLPEMKRDTAALITAFQLAWYIPPNRKLVELGFDPITDKTFDEPWIPDGVRPLSNVLTSLEFNETNENANDDDIDL